MTVPCGADKVHSKFALLLLMVQEPPEPAVTLPCLSNAVPVMGVLHSDGGLSANIAVTLRAPPMFTEQAPVPLQAPLQLEKTLPPAAIGFSVTIVPELKLAEQVGEQLIPDGKPATVPMPGPAMLTAKA